MIHSRRDHQRCQRVPRRAPKHEHINKRLKLNSALNCQQKRLSLQIPIKENITQTTDKQQQQQQQIIIIIIIIIITNTGSRVETGHPLTPKPYTRNDKTLNPKSLNDKPLKPQTLKP